MTPMPINPTISAPPICSWCNSAGQQWTPAPAEDYISLFSYRSRVRTDRSSGDGLNPAGDFALREASRDGLAGYDLIGGLDEGTGGVVEGQAIAAGEDGERAEGVEAGGESGEAEAAVV